MMKSAASPRVATGNVCKTKMYLYDSAGVSSTLSTISSKGTYYSIKDSNNNYGFYTTTGVISYNANGGTGSYSSKNITIGANGYTISNSDITMEGLVEM